MSLKEELAAARAKMQESNVQVPPASQPMGTSSENPLQAELAAMRQKMGHGTERRPNERQVSSEEDLAAQQVLTAPSPQETTRHPIGATAFGIGAGIAAAPLGPAVAIAASALASGIGEVGQNVIEIALDLPTKPKDVPDLLGRIGKEVALGSVSELAGRAILPTVKATKLLFFTPRTVSPEAREAMKFLQQEGSELPLLPAKATESFGIDMLHNMAEHSFTGGATMKRFAANQNQFMNDLAENLVDRIGPHLTPEQAGEALIKSAAGNLRETRKPATVLYNSVQEAIAPKKVIKKVPVEVETGVLGPTGQSMTRTVMQDKEQLVGGLRVGFQDIKDFVATKADVQERLAGIGSEITGGNLLMRFNQISNKPYVSDLMEFRTTIRGMKEGLEAGITTKKDPQIGLLKKLEHDISARIDLALRGHDPLIAAAKNEADRIWKYGSKTYNNKVIRQLAQKMDMERTGAPERVVKAVFAPQSLTRMQTVKDAITPKAWEKVSRQGMEMVLKNSTKDNVIDGGKLLEGLIGKNGLGERGLVTAVGPIEAQNWISFAKAAKLQQAAQSGGEGSMAIQLRQPGALLELAGGSLALTGLATEDTSLSGTGALILGLPYISAKVMTNPRAAKALIDGMQTKKGSPSYAGIAARLVEALVPRKVEVQPSRNDRPAQPVASAQPSIGQSRALAIQQ